MQSDAIKQEKPCFQLLCQKLKQPTYLIFVKAEVTIDEQLLACLDYNWSRRLFGYRNPSHAFEKKKVKTTFLSNKYLTWDQERTNCRLLPHFPCFYPKACWPCCPFLCKVTICLLGTWILASENFTFRKWIISILPLAVLLTACLQLIPLERWPRLLQSGRGWPARYPSLHNTAT